MHRILGNVECHQGGHELTNLFLRKVFTQNNAFEFVEQKDFKISEKFSSQELDKLAVNA